MIKMEDNKEVKEEYQDILKYLSDEQKQEIEKLEDELKKLKAENLANEIKHKLQIKINEEKRKSKKKSIEGKGLMKAYARVLQRFIRWWTMADLLPEERAERKKKFEEATRNLFGMDNRGEMPRFNFLESYPDPTYQQDKKKKVIEEDRPPFYFDPLK